MQCSIITARKYLMENKINRNYKERMERQKQMSKKEGKK